MAAEFDEARIEEATKKASRMRLLLKVIRCNIFFKGAIRCITSY
jgi:hypothetical protein